VTPFAFSIKTAMRPDPADRDYARHYTEVLDEVRFADQRGYALILAYYELRQLLESASFLDALSAGRSWHDDCLTCGNRRHGTSWSSTHGFPGSRTIRPWNR
jgi:hypothetical protein